MQVAESDDCQVEDFFRHGVAPALFAVCNLQFAIYKLLPHQLQIAI
jgi:hypothetical protein